ncbi:MAG: hypothetical protein AAFZ04_16605 [Pseudomonadota bacterium]
MKTALGILFLMISTTASFAGSESERRTQCLGWMMQGYPSGLEETSCTNQFSLPSPFLFKCVRAERRGYDSDLQRNACALFLEEASLRAENGYVRN